MSKVLHCIALYCTFCRGFWFSTALRVMLLTCVGQSSALARNTLLPPFHPDEASLEGAFWSGALPSSRQRKSSNVVSKDSIMRQFTLTQQRPGVHSAWCARPRVHTAATALPSAAALGIATRARVTEQHLAGGLIYVSSGELEHGWLYMCHSTDG
jgi:hypothetical protein